MRSSWPVRVLLPATQVLAEGSWLAVVYAGVQALSGQPAWFGPLELALLAWAGMAWGRRTRWRSPAAEALGLPLLALASGALGWLLDPAVRQAMIQGDPAMALGLHGPGWLAGAAFWRGEVHRTAEDDDAIQDRLLRWVVPGLAIPWAIGHLATEGALEAEFVAAAFIGTVFFVASAFIAMGLARLEAVRASTGSDWRANRSWVAVVMVIALGVTAAAIPAAALLGVPARSLMVALFGPIQALLFVALLLVTPLVILAAAMADAIRPLLPQGITLPHIGIPSFAADGRQLVNSVPVIVFYLAIGAVLLVELLIAAFIIWVRWQERRRMRLAPIDDFEERSIVIPEPEPPAPRAARSPARRQRTLGDDPAGAYLQALDALERDGRWARRPGETPAEHAGRIRAEGLALPAFARLAAAFQLVRYGDRRLPARERSRAPARLRLVHRLLRG
jgi:hypothetical protein